MEQKESYTIRELFDKLGITLAELGRRSGISEITVAKMRDGVSVRRSTANTLLQTLSEIYKLRLSLDNVSGIVIRDKIAKQSSVQPVESPVEAAISSDTRSISRPEIRRTGTKKGPQNRDLPEGCLLARDFAKRHGVNPMTFRDHMTVGIGRGLPPEQKDKVEASERPKPGREDIETERYLTREQQAKAIEYWRRHHITFTLPEA